MKTSIFAILIGLLCVFGCNEKKESPVSIKETTKETIVFSIPTSTFSRIGNEESIKGIITNTSDLAFDIVSLKITRTEGESTIEFGYMGPHQSRTFDTGPGSPLQSLDILVNKEHFQTLHW